MHSFKSIAAAWLSVAILTVIGLVPHASACCSCGCLLSPEWAIQGFSSEPGFKTNLVYTYLDQHQLRSGTRKLSASEVPDGQELEAYTRNHYLTLDLAYVINPDWSAVLQVPFIVRDHATYGEDHASYDSSSTSSIGDMNLVASYQGFGASHKLGVKFGLSLPTGAFTDTFRSGAPLDRGLQAGVGTTGVIAGVYYHDLLTKDWGYFGEATTQAALNYRSDYQPGSAEKLSIGLRFTGIERITPQLQVNAKISARDLGGQSDHFNSGGTLVYLSPGVTVDLTKTLSSYAFVQLPLYQNVNGYQLAPTWILSVGIHSAF
ncbi:MAG: TonB-dependent receptor [Verrucomicrobia bacterium]|nr:MAG: TonB-dependent receptor [Verrucomicrobiota bacterium]